MSQTGTRQTFDPAPVLARYYGLTNREIAEVLGVTPQTIDSWRQGRRGLKAKRADEIAIKHLGLHPALLWPDTWYRETA